MLLFEWASRIETVGYKLAEGKGLREGRDSKELWKSVEMLKADLSRGPQKISRPKFGHWRPSTHQWRFTNTSK